MIGHGTAGGTHRDGSTFYSVKRLIGRCLRDVAADAADLSYAVTAHESFERHADAESRHRGAPSDSSSNGTQESGGGALWEPIGGEVGGGRWADSTHDSSSGAAEENGARQSDSGVSASRRADVAALRVVCPARRALLSPEEISAHLLAHLLSRAAVLAGGGGKVSGGGIENAVSFKLSIVVRRCMASTAPSTLLRGWHAHLMQVWRGSTGACTGACPAGKLCRSPPFPDSMCGGVCSQQSHSCLRDV